MLMCRVPARLRIPETPVGVRDASSVRLMNDASRGQGYRGALPWAFGFLILCALIAFVLHVGTIARFVDLARQARPEWLAAAFCAQAATYMSCALVWRQVLRHAAHPRPLRMLLPLAVAKLFADQAVPSGGASGTVLVVAGLQRQGVPLSLAMGTLLVGLVSFYAAYLAVALVSVGILWGLHKLDVAILALVTAFAAIAVIFPGAAIWLTRRIDRITLPRWATRLRWVRILQKALAEAPLDLLRNPLLMAEAVALQLSIILLDAATLWIAFRALGEPVTLWRALVSFVMASVAADVAPVPLGLGTFESASVAMLDLLGVGIEIALAATLLLRGFTFWLPMLPGLWLARREIGSGSKTDIAS